MVSNIKGTTNALVLNRKGPVERGSSSKSIKATIKKPYKYKANSKYYIVVSIVVVLLTSL